MHLPARRTPPQRAALRAWTQALLALLLLVSSLAAPMHSAAAPAQSPLAQQADASIRAAAMLEKMSPEEKVGQLFLVSFNGASIEPETPIYALITSYHIGGVVLKASNDNFIAAPDTVQGVLDLTTGLQRTKWAASQQAIPREGSTETFSPAFIPLFVGLSQEGNGAPFDQILDGLTVLPSQMTIGATWNTDFARQTGFIQGKELSSLGVNLLLGPALDVLEIPNPDTSGDLGTRVFGGDPFWVAQMGKAYIQGVHEGSSYRMAVIAKHFPGLGSANRSPTEEVPSVRKSLEQLRQIELAPFIAITGNSPALETTTDGLLVTHIRYQGLQGNIRATTRPVSLDEAALGQLLSTPALKVWRDNGGLLVSDDLGSRGLRRLLDPEDVNYNARVVVRDAFLAGNDVLNLGSIIETGDPDSFTTTQKIISFFVNKYNEDIAFAQRVDQAVLRILTLKYRLYGSFTLDRTFTNPNSLSQLQSTPQSSLDILLNGATLLSPQPEELSTVLPNGPELNEQQIIFTDSVIYTQCSACPQQESPAVTALQQAILRLYGPGAGGLATARNLSSYSFTDLAAFLDGVGAAELESQLRNAEWVIFLMRDIQTARPASLALQRILSERPELLRGKEVIAFSLGAPYYLDTTDITRLTAYFALYSKTPQAIETAARILYSEIDIPLGSLPVSVQGIGYELISATAPDPAQIIPLMFDLPQETPLPTSGENTPTPTATPVYRPGDQVAVRTGVIVDQNGNPVPDGTLAQFILIQGGLETVSPRIETAGGIARATLQIPGEGTFEIRAIAGDAAQSQIIRVEMPVPEGTAQPTPTEMPSPTATPSPSPEPTLTPTEVPQTPTPTVPENKTYTDGADWLIALATSLAVGLVAYWVGGSPRQAGWQIRWVLGALLGGFGVFLYMALGLPGGPQILSAIGRWGVFILVLGGAGLGFVTGMVIFLTNQRNQ